MDWVVIFAVGVLIIAFIVAIVFNRDSSNGTDKYGQKPTFFMSKKEWGRN